MRSTFKTILLSERSLIPKRADCDFIYKISCSRQTHPMVGRPPGERGPPPGLSGQPPGLSEWPRGGHGISLSLGCPQCEFPRRQARCLWAPTVLTAQAGPCPPCEPQPPRASVPARSWPRPPRQGQGRPLGPGAGASGRPVWGWVLSTNQSGLGTPVLPQSTGRGGEGFGGPPSPFVPVSGAPKANEHAALRIKAPCPEF